MDEVKALRRVVNSHYEFKPVLPRESTYQPGVNNTSQTTFTVTPNTVLNLSKSKLEFTLTVPEEGNAVDRVIIDKSTMPIKSVRVESNNQILVEINDLQPYIKMIKPTIKNTYDVSEYEPDYATGKGHWWRRATNTKGNELYAADSIDLPTPATILPGAGNPIFPDVNSTGIENLDNIINPTFQERFWISGQFSTGVNAVAPVSSVAEELKTAGGGAGNAATVYRAYAPASRGVPALVAGQHARFNVSIPLRDLVPYSLLSVNKDLLVGSNFNIVITWASSASFITQYTSGGGGAGVIPNWLGYMPARIALMNTAENGGGFAVPAAPHTIASPTIRLAIQKSKIMIDSVESYVKGSGISIVVPYVVFNNPGLDAGSTVGRVTVSLYKALHNRVMRMYFANYLTAQKYHWTSANIRGSTMDNLRFAINNAYETDTVIKYDDFILDNKKFLSDCLLGTSLDYAAGNFTAVKDFSGLSSKRLLAYGWTKQGMTLETPKTILLEFSKPAIASQMYVAIICQKPMMFKYLPQVNDVAIQFTNDAVLTQ